LTSVLTRRSSRTVTVAVSVLVGGASIAQSQTVPRVPVAAIVEVKKPWHAPAFYVRFKIRETTKQFAALPGLSFKAFTISRDGAFGGVYLWIDRAHATGWFNEKWHQGVRRQRGVDGEVRLFDAPVVTDNFPGGTAANDGADAIVTVAFLPMPGGVTREQAIAGFRASVPEYRTVPGLLRKYFVLTDDRPFGGVYLWATSADVERYFSAQWRAAARSRFGAEPTLEWFDAPVLTTSTVVATAIAMTP
jgi:hypothetical protein